jgi:cellulose synthase/poly-beta-1,6-N-acetylglucosamine synthase-like glycosyltransferase
MNKLMCSIGVIVYNEAKNIGNLLELITSENYKDVEITEIIVVSSACTDGTDEIVNYYEKHDKRVKLITEPERKGKSSAINLFLKNSSNELLIIESGDTIPAEGTIRKLILPFQNPEIGMTGGRPVPVNTSITFSGYAVNLLWKLHHKMSLKSPKLGEMIAFRRVFDSIPADSAVDEASIEALIAKKNLTKLYIPDAIIHNKGPEEISGFIKQRKRIETGHLWLTKKYNYQVVSQKKSILFSLLKEEILERPQELFKIFAVMFVEIYARMLGRFDYYIKKKNPFTWEIISSTKNLRKG